MINPELRLEIVALSEIPDGEEISNSYLGTDFQPTEARRSYLRENWYFDCRCLRCLDPTECGSHLSSLVCPKPKCGQPVSSTNPLSNSAEWMCSFCSHTLSPNTVKSKLHVFEELIKRSPEIIDQDLVSQVEHYERVLHQMSFHLHQNHHLQIIVKQRLISLYCCYKMLSSPARQRKLQLCHDLVNSISKVQLTKSKGVKSED